MAQKKGGRKRGKSGKKRRREMRTQLLAYLVDKENDLTVRYQEWGTSQKKTHSAPEGEVAVARRLGMQLMSIKGMINGFGGNARKMKGSDVKKILTLLQKAEFRMRVLEHKALARGITPSSSKNIINSETKKLRTNIMKHSTHKPAVLFPAVLFPAVLS